MTGQECETGIAWWQGIVVVLGIVALAALVWGFAWWLGNRAEKPKYGLMQTLGKGYAEYDARFRDSHEVAQAALREAEKWKRLRYCLMPDGSRRIVTQEQHAAAWNAYAEAFNNHVCKPPSSSLWTCSCEERGYNAAMNALRPGRGDA